MDGWMNGWGKEAGGGGGEERKKGEGRQASSLPFPLF